MSRLLEDAVEVLRQLPDDLQQTAARAIISFGAGQDEDLRLSDAQVAEIEGRIASPNRTMLTLDETRNQLRRYGV